ncbi:MAG: PHB depolymerase family esterase [Clostridia bacterium]|nr:PHB depolymerase family esterase [Clostridia bacterium]
MKKLLICLVALILFTMTVATAQPIEARPFTTDMTVDTSTDLYLSAYYGLWSMDIDVEGAMRTMCVYVPESYFPCCDMLLVVAPDGKTAEEFANESGWMPIAEKYGFGIAFFEAKDGVWNLEDPSGELAYYQTAINVFGNREIIDFGEASLYMIGYGEGASVAQIISLSYSSMLAGVVAMGGSDVDADYIRKVGDEQSIVFSINVDFDTRLDGYYNKDVVMPIWIVNDGDSNQALTDYWLNANDVIDEGLYNEYGRVYIQDELHMDGTINNKALSRVWISEMEGAAGYFDEAFQEDMWNNFFTERRRFSSEPNGALRVGYTLEEIGMKQYSAQIDGVTRYWLVYVPTGYDATSEVPLLVANHGHAARAEVYAQHSEWWRVAEARGFIVVFPQGSRCVNHTLCGCTRWASEEWEADYIRTVLESVTTEYSIDTSRIYVTGHSNGGQFTGYLAIELSDVFAAAANIGGTYSQLAETPTHEQGVYMPYLGIVGQYDLMGMGVYEDADDNRTFNHMKQRLAYNGMEEAIPLIKNTGSYTQYYYYGSELNIPMVQVMINDNFHHSYVPQYAWLAWDEFFSLYSRGEDGTLYYCSTAVN